MHHAADWTLADLTDQASRTFVVTGASSGLGVAITRHVASISGPLLVDDADAEVATAAASALTRFRHPDAVPGLVRGLAHPTPGVWKESLGALSAIGDISALPAMLRVVEWHGPEARELLERGLDHIPLETLLPALLQALEDPSASVRETAGLSLGARGGAQDVEALAKKLNAPRGEVRVAVVRALAQLLDADATLVADPGTPCPYFSAYYPVKGTGRRFFSNRAHGALGYALAASVGAHIGRPQVKTVAVMGDGSFGMCAGELETVMRLKLPITFVVISNAAYGWSKAGQ
jgi:hypothetical protein